MSGYNVEQLKALALDVMAKEEIVTWGELWDSMMISPTTAYKYGLEQMEDIKSELYRHKNKRKKRMRRRWAESDVPALQIAEYKLLADDDELSRLSTSKITADSSPDSRKMTYRSRTWIVRWITMPTNRP